MIFGKFAQKIKRWITWRVLTRAMHVSIEGLENLPSSGPYILIWNHLHISDRLLLWSGAAVTTAFVTTDKFHRRNAFVDAYVRGDILVRHGTVDRHAVQRALEILKKGNPVAIAPEGRVSRTGALCRAELGVASLVCHSGAPVIPVAIWGQFQAHKTWLRFRRPRVVIRYGVAMKFPQRRATHFTLQNLTTEIMTGLAQTLPSEYRGFYGQFRRKTADRFIQTFTDYHQYANSQSKPLQSGIEAPTALLPEQEESELVH